MNPYRRIESGEEGQEFPYEYDMLIGPNGFECLLTEPEDRNWYRDGREVVDELNRLYNLVQEYKQDAEKYRGLCE